MCYCDLDPPSAYVERLRVARKDHSCEECGSLIRKGDLYEYSSGIWDGRGASHKMCASCKTLVNLAQSLHDDEPFCFAFGGLGEALTECFPEIFRNEEGESTW